MRLRISATQIDRYQMMYATDWYTEEKAYDDLTKPFQETDPIIVGKAIHRLAQEGTSIVQPMPGQEGFWYLDNVAFNSPSLDSLNQLHKSMVPYMTACEVRKEVPLSCWVPSLGEVEVSLVCKADCITPTEAQDIKVSKKPADVELYQSLVQWKAYLYAFGMDTFRFIYIQPDYDRTPLQPGDKPCLLVKSIKGYDYSEHTSYPGLAQDLQDITGRFIDWANRREILHLFRPLI